MSYIGKTNWQYDEIVKEADLNRIEQGVVDAHTKVEAAKAETTTYTDTKIAEVTAVALGAAKKADFDAHAADARLHVTAAKQTAWDAKETTVGAQEKVNAALAAAKADAQEKANGALAAAKADAQEKANAALHAAKADASAKANGAEQNAKNASLPRTGGTIDGQLSVNAGGGAVRLIGGDHVYQEFYPKGLNQGRKGYVGYADQHATELTIHNELHNGAVKIFAPRGLIVNDIDILAKLKELRSNPFYYNHGEEKFATWSPLHPVSGISFIKKADHLSFSGELSSGGGTTTLISNIPIDITELSRLKIDVEKKPGSSWNNRDTGNARLYVATTRDGQAIKQVWASNSSGIGIVRTMIELSVAELTGPLYIGISFNTYSESWRNHDCQVFRIWGEY